MVTSPTFICPGFPKAGTTWLYSNLKKHPQVFLPYKKELNFFGLMEYKNFAFPFTKHWAAKQVKAFFKNEIIKLQPISIFFQKLNWFLKYLNAKTYSQYQSLFNPKLISGDISPFYNNLDINKVKQIKSNLPNLKVILLIRNPIERVWSHLKMDVFNSFNIKNIKESDFEIIKKVLNKELQRISCVEFAKIWIEIFGSKNVQIIFYDEISNNSLQTYQKICSFLNISINEVTEDTLLKKVNFTKYSNFPKFYKDYLSKKLQNEIFEAKAYFKNSFVESW